MRLSPFIFYLIKLKSVGLKKKTFNCSELSLSSNTSRLTPCNVTMEFTESVEVWECVAVKVLLGLFSLVGFAENVVVIVAILTSYILRDIPSNWFVLSLAFGDVLFCVYSSVIFIHLQPKKNLPNVLNSLWYIKPLALISYLSSSSSLFVLIFNRFLSIYDSLKYRSRMTLERAKRLIFLLWVLIVLMAIFSEILSFICFSLCCLSIVALNVYLLKKASEQRRAIKRQHAAVITGQKKSMMNEYRSFFRLAVVTFTFGVASIFNIAFEVFRLKGLTRKSVSFERMLLVCVMLFAINSVFDPLVYCMTSNEFKRIFKKMKGRLSGQVNQYSLGQRRLNSPPFIIRRNYIGPLMNHWRITENNNSLNLALNGEFSTCRGTPSRTALLN